jgi:pimeloyl-ACP methyl ester carboxylesterase
MRRLGQAGLAHRAVDLPSAGRDRDGLGDLHADAAVVRAAVDGCASAVVVGHSYGGNPMTQGLAGAVNVRRLVYLAAFMLAEDQTIGDISDEGGDDWVVSTDGVTVEARDPASLFYNQCSPQVRQAAIEDLVPQASVAFVQPVQHAAWRTIPSTYVVCDDDHAIPPRFQRAMAQQADEVHTLASDHSPFLSHPDATTALLRSIAGV